MAAETWTVDQVSVLASTGVAAGATSTPAPLDIHGYNHAWITWACTTGAVAAPSGMQLNIYPMTGSGPTADTVSTIPYVVAVTASGSFRKSIRLEVGKYSLSMTNLDGTNALSSCSITGDRYALSFN